jgi:hypothetical protein
LFTAPLIAATSLQELVHREAFELGGQLLHGGAYGRYLAEFGIERGEDGRLVRMEIEVDVQLAGEQALQTQPRPQAALDQLADGGTVAQVDVFAASRSHHLGLHFDHHRHHEATALRVEAELDLLHRADLDAEEDHRRADLQALRRTFEIQHMLPALAEPAAAGQQQRGHDGQRQGAEHEGADQGGIGFSAHADSEGPPRGGSEPSSGKPRRG